MQVEPQNTIPLLYQITDPSDSTVYFIRATVYDSLTRNVLATQNLVSRGGGLWSSTIVPPVDSTGLGRHIHVIIKVYTDSGYTTLSSAYNQQIDKYLVKSSSRFGGGGGGGQEIDYDKIKKIVDASVTEKINSEQKINDVISGLLLKLSSIQDSIKSLEDSSKEDDSAEEDTNQMESEDKPIDFSPVKEELKSIESSLLGKLEEIETQIPKDNSISIKELGNRINMVMDMIKNLSDMLDNMDTNVSSLVNKINETVDSLSKEKGDNGNKLRIEFSGANSGGENSGIKKYL